VGTDRLSGTPAVCTQVSLVRYGTLFAAVGVTVALLWAVAFGPTIGCTDVACPGTTSTYSIASVSLVPLRVGISDGNNTCLVALPVVIGTIAAVVGVVGGVAGQIWQASA
jgi:hypothetical protein